MAPKRDKAQGRRERGQFLALPSNVLESENFRTLSARATKLLLCLLAQLRFGRGGIANNGDLCLAHSIAKQWGLISKGTLHLAIKELIERGWIIKTRQGGPAGMGPCLYAITIWAIDDCGSKLEVEPTNAPLGTWKTWKP